MIPKETCDLAHFLERSHQAAQQFHVAPLEYSLSTMTGPMPGGPCIICGWLIFAVYLFIGCLLQSGCSTKAMVEERMETTQKGEEKKERCVRNAFQKDLRRRCEKNAGLSFKPYVTLHRGNESSANAPGVHIGATFYC